MRFDRVELREIRLDLVAPFETSFGRTTSRRITLVEVRRGESGWGERIAPEGPSFNEAFTESAWEVLSRFVVPCVLALDGDDPALVAGGFVPNDRATRRPAGASPVDERLARPRRSGLSSARHAEFTPIST